MNSNALYYPYIRVPESAWFTRVLLYWDQVGAVVPYEFIEDPERLGPYMHSLVQEQLVKQVVPGMYLWKVDDFSSSFLEYVDAKYGAHGRPYKSDWAAIHSKKLAGSPVHMEKLHELEESLCNQGMARRNKDDEYSPWLEIEPRIASDFMAYLAGVLGQIADDVSFSPVTNLHSNLETFIPQAQPDDTKCRVRELLLERILPAPGEALCASQLLDFKMEHKQLLRRFRREVEDKISEISVISDEEFRLMRMDDITRSFNETIEEITHRMEEQKNWPNLEFGTVCTILGSGMAAWSAVVNQDWKFGATGAALSMAPAIYSALHGSDVKWTDQPLAYAAFANTKL